MRIIDSADINKVKWDQLVARTTDASFFSYSWYLDSCASTWSVIVDETYNKGLALPITINLGVLELYTPVFVRYVEVLGEDVDLKIVRQLIEEKFKNRSLASKQLIFPEKSKEFVFQSLRNEREQIIGSQGKRMIKKALKSAFEVKLVNNYANVLSSISRHLKGKFEGIDSKSILNMETLLSKAKESNMLIAFEVSDGGIICLENENQVLYLKGAVSEEAKKNGAMYLALNEAINYARSKNKLFDFGGSRISGVRQFNKNLGGIDQVYYHNAVNSFPYWFKFARRIKTWIKK